MPGGRAKWRVTARDDGGLWVSDEMDADAWDDFVGRAGGRLSQTAAWGEVKALQGWRPVRVAVGGRDGLLAGAQILVRRYPVLGSIAYLDGGPLTISHDASPAVLLVKALDRVCARLRVRSLAVDPAPGHESVLRAMVDYGYGPAQVKTALAATVQVDLTRDDDEILAGMKSKTRYNIRRGMRAGVNVRRLGPEGLDVFNRVLRATGARQGFLPPPPAYFARLFERLWPLGRIHLFVADVEDEPMSAILVTAFGNTVVYKRGGWDGSHGDKRPNEVLHWRAMQWARSAGYSRYDFDGIEPDIARLIVDGEDLPSMENVTRFKLGFGGDVVLLPESLSYVPNRILRFGYDRVLPLVRRSRVFKRTVKRLRAS